MKTAAASLLCVMALCFAGFSPVRTHAHAAPKVQMEQYEHVPAPQSTSLTLTIDGKATTLSVADLQAMPQKTVTVHNEHTKADETYAGVLLGDFAGEVWISYR